MAKNTEAEKNVLPIPGKFSPTDVSLYGGKKVWQYDGTVNLIGDYIASLPSGAQYGLASGLKIAAADLCRKAWDRKGHNCANSTVEQWHAHCTEFLSKQYTADELAGDKTVAGMSKGRTASDPAAAVLRRQERDVVKLYNRGLDMQRIATAMHLTPSYVSTVLERAGVLKGQK